MSRGSMVYQVQTILCQQLRTGESKHNAKIKEKTHSPDGIFAYGTLSAYMDNCIDFARWVKETHRVNTLEKAKPYIEEYLKLGIVNGLSAPTLSLRRAAVCKLYGIHAEDIAVVLPERRRADISRSRGDAKRDYGFSLRNNAAIINFAKATGLRRHELAAIKDTQIAVQPDGSVEILNVIGKGGKIRNVEVIPGMETAVSRFAGVTGKRVFCSVPSHMDVHSYRREYAQAMYETYQKQLERTEGRTLSNIPRKEKYICRCDKKGIVYDKRVMRYVSRQLGHNRIDVIAGHYLD